MRRVYELRDEGEPLPVIAAILNAEGYRTAIGATYSAIDVWRILGERRKGHLHAVGEGTADQHAGQGRHAHLRGPEPGRRRGDELIQAVEATGC